MLRSIRLGFLGATALVALSTALPRPSFAALEDTQSYIADAQARIAKGDLRGAEIQLRKAVQANPNEPLLHVELARLYLDMENLPAAEAEARLARSDKGPADQVDPSLAQALLQQNKVSELFRDVQPGNRAAKAESAVRLALGLGHLRLQELSQAEQLLGDAERLDPGAAAPKVGMAQLDLANDDLAAAQREIDGALAIAPNDSDAIRISALVLRAQGDADGAIAKLNALLAKKPDDPAALAIRAETLMGQSKFDAAQADVNRALALTPSNAGVIFLDGVLLAQEGKLAEADAQLSKASIAFDDLPYGYYLEGIVKYRRKQYEQASAYFSKYLARFPKAVLPRQLMARIDLVKRDYPAAISILKPALDANPSDTTSALLLAQAYAASGRRNDAIELYQRAAQAKPDDLQAAANLAAEQAGLGDVQEGLASLDKLARTAEGAAIAGPALVMADLDTGHIAAAAEAAETLVKAKPRDATAQSLLATVRMVQGNYAEAQSIFAAIAQRDSTLPAAQRGLAEADLALGKLDDAKTALQALVKKNPASIPDVVALARLYQQQGDETAAVSLLKDTQHGLVNSPAPGVVLLEIYRDAKEWDKAKAYGQDLEGQFPADPAVVDAIASLDIAAGDPKGAAAEFGKLLLAQPNSPALLLRYAQYQSDAGNTAGARVSLKNAISLAPRDPGPMQALVALELRADGEDAALATAKSFAENDLALSQTLSADALVSAGHSERAIALLTEAQKQHPSGEIEAKLANILYATGKEKEAQQLLEGWVKDHDDRAPRLTLATIYMNEQADAAARPLYEKLLEQDPYDLGVLNNLALLYAKEHDSRAINLAAEAYHLAPDPHVADTFGWILVGEGQANVALPLLQGASAALPKDAEVSYHLAAAFEALGRTKEARSILEPLLKSGDAFDGQADAKRLMAKLEHG